MIVTTNNGYSFQVDESDSCIALERGWYGKINRNKRLNGNYGKARIYIQRHVYKNGKRVEEFLHRRILNAPHGILCDHKNGDTLDCRRQNLRLCNHAQNMANQEIHTDNSCGYKGVCWNKVVKRWQAGIGVNRKHVALGYYNSKEEAALIYNQAAIKYFGEFAKINELHGI